MLRCLDLRLVIHFTRTRRSPHKTEDWKQMDRDNVHASFGQPCQAFMRRAVNCSDCSRLIKPLLSSSTQALVMLHIFICIYAYLLYIRESRLLVLPLTNNVCPRSISTLPRPSYRRRFQPRQDSYVFSYRYTLVHNSHTLSLKIDVAVSPNNNEVHIYQRQGAEWIHKDTLAEVRFPVVSHNDRRVDT